MYSKRLIFLYVRAIYYMDNNNANTLDTFVVMFHKDLKLIGKKVTLQSYTKLSHVDVINVIPALLYI